MGGNGTPAKLKNLGERLAFVRRSRDDRPTPHKPSIVNELPVADAQARYQIGKTALNSRIRHCGIVPLRSGNRTYLTPQHIEILDALNTHLEGGRGMGDFHSPIAQLVEEETVGDRSAIVREEVRHPVRIEFPMAPPQGERSRVIALREALEFLSDCAERRWLLPTSEIRTILGAAPRRSGWCRFGFVFEAAGAHGNETAWAVRSVEAD